jgi:hypothetical protein
LQQDYGDRLDESVSSAQLGNYGSQDSKTSIRNYEHRNKDSRGSDTVTKQNMDVAGDHNDTRQKSRTELTNIRSRNK